MRPPQGGVERGEASKSSFANFTLMKNAVATFMSNIDLSIIPSTITRQPDGSHKVQLSLNGILTASTNDLPKDLTDDEVRELVSNGSIEVRLFNCFNL